MTLDRKGFAHVTNLEDLCAALEASGEKIVTLGDGTRMVAGRGDGEPSAITLSWHGEGVKLVEVLKLEFLRERTRELESLVAHANAQLAVTAFQLRPGKAGFRVAHVSHAVLDHEGRVSSRAVSELIRIARLAIRERLPGLRALAASPPGHGPRLVAPGDPAAFAAATERARDKRAALGVAPPARPLAPEERARLVQAFARDLARFGDRAVTAALTDVGTPFFKRVQILRVESSVPFPAQAAYAAWTSSGPLVLTDNPSALSAICAEEKPAHASDPDLALLLALMAGMWIGASVLNEMRIASVDDIPFRRAGAEDHAREAEIRHVYGAEITPAGLELLADGVRVVTWLVSAGRLRHRVVEVRASGVSAFERMVADLPVHPGRMWGNVGGRLVPIG